MKPFRILVNYKLKKGTREEFLKELSQTGFAAKVRAEEGCLLYDYYMSCEDADKVLLVESWTSEDCQQKHLKQPHMGLLKPLKEKYIEKTDLEIWK